MGALAKFLKSVTCMLVTMVTIGRPKCTRKYRTPVCRTKNCFIFSLLYAVVSAPLDLSAPFAMWDVGSES